MSLDAGIVLGRYVIQSRLGAGGMGEVYLARDPQLQRSVALKILPENFASDQQRMRRFIQEAKTAATLRHPNVAHIYEIGVQDGIRFISMVDQPISSYQVRFEISLVRDAARSKPHRVGSGTRIITDGATSSAGN